MAASEPSFDFPSTTKCSTSGYVCVATLAMGLAVIVRINETYGSIEEDEVIDLVEREDQAE